MTSLLTVEEHGEILACWAEQGFQGETVICFDRHLDLKPVTSAPQGSLADSHRRVPFQDDDSTSHGLDDFLDLAGKLGLVERVVWVCPESPRESLWEQVSWFADHGDQIGATWEGCEHGARVRVGAIQIESTTLDDLDKVRGLEGAKVDVDLDYFCDEQGRMGVSPSSWLALTGELHLHDSILSLCYSELSGFLPTPQRSIGQEISRGLRRPLLANTPRRALAPRTMDLLAGREGEQTSLDALIDEELGELGGPGWALASVAASHLGELARAEGLFELARAAGDRARWAAFALTHAHHLRAQHDSAVFWSQQVVGPRADPIWARARLLGSIAALRARKDKVAANLAAELVQAVPLRPEPAHILRMARPS